MSADITFRRTTTACWREGRLQRRSRVEIFQGDIAQPWVIDEASAGWNVRHRHRQPAQSLPYRTLEQAQAAVRRVVSHSPQIALGDA